MKLIIRCLEGGHEFITDGEIVFANGEILADTIKDVTRKDNEGNLIVECKNLTEYAETLENVMDVLERDKNVNSVGISMGNVTC